uniref:Putative YopX protein n=1 Tax=viral metagenome TaxID=1070528 RepID=A0A6M3JAP5_9ZZZZ
MREIKFRAWNKMHDLGMLPVSQLSWDEHDDGILRLHFCGSTDGKMHGSFGVHSGLGNVDGSEETGWVLMQYTGLLDKQGKEIYEGDIVNFKEGKTYHYGMTGATIEYSEGGFFPFADNGDNMPYPKPNECEVVGNIYEEAK